MEARSGLRRLHSITGLVPIGAFLFFHLWTNRAAARGADAFDAAARRLQRIPLSLAAEVLLIALPIAFHALYGLYLAATRDPGWPSPAPARRVLSKIQRATGVVVFVFLFFHLWTGRLVQIRDHSSVDLFRLMQALLASPWIAALYGLGVFAAILHLSTGVWTFADAWGLLRSRGARTATAAAAAAVFAILSVWGVVALRGFGLKP